MRTSSRILISLAVAIVVFGALSLWTEWGQKDFSVDADAIGAFAFLAVICLVVGVVLNALSKAGEPPVEAADETPGDDEADGPGTPLCPSCLAPAKLLQHFCSECGSPMTSHAAIDPLGQVYSMGDTFRKAATGPRRLAVLIGMWCIFGPLLIGCIITLTVALNRPPEFSIIEEGSELVDWGEAPPAPARWTPASILKVVVVIGFLVLNAAILIKTTRNYFRKRQASGSDADDAENTENIEVDA